MAQMWIGGRGTGGAGGRVFDVVKPATGEAIDTAPRAGAADVGKAGAAPPRALPEWRRPPGSERAEKLAPAPGAGNTGVAKPSEHTPLSTLRLAKALEDLPEGVVNVITGYGPEAGMPLVAHRDVELVAFTGSQATGRKVAVTCAEQLKKCHLELGGNDPLIVDEGVDLDVAAKGAAWAGYLNLGQVCTSAERFYVVGRAYDEFVERFVAFTRTLRIGDPLGPDVDLGPMISAVQREKVEQKGAACLRAGARLAVGGKRPAGFDKGYFYEPTALLDVTPEMPLLREETFGPVAPIVRCRDIDEAIA